MASTTVTYPEWFDESIVNQALGEERFAEGTLHRDERLDLWGFLKHYLPSGYTPSDRITLPPEAHSRFEQLCDAVTVETLRYEFHGQPPMSPYRLALTLCQSPGTASQRRGRDISQDGDGEQPPYSVEHLNKGSQVRVTVDDTDIELTTDGVVGTDAVGRPYCIPADALGVDQERLLSQDVSVSTRNGMTQITLGI